MAAKRFIAENAGRLDRVLSELASVSRSQAARLVTDARVTVNDKVITKASYMVVVGSTIEADLTPADPTDGLPPYDIPLDIVFEDEWLLVINKPAGLTVHPGAGNPLRTLANALAARPGALALPRAGIVHRLDKDTSGLLVVAKDVKTHEALSRQFAERTVSRSYLALAQSTPRGGRLFRGASTGEMSGAIGRDPRDRKRMAVRTSGRRSKTSWTLVELFPYAGLVRVVLGTGRTHQIRVHFADAGAPLIGDPVYGDDQKLPAPLRSAAQKLGRQALHAELLGILHPARLTRTEWRCKPPIDLEETIQRFRDFNS